ncbi:MAG: Gx transporter family protein, partial [Erysipelotrichaceae bacterium]|nr:Gx transporter family protein [Erysipelotrichaceae bacterium]
RRFVYLALFSAMAIVLSIIESIYIGPVFFMVRIGLANIVALVTVKILGVKEMIIVNTMRVVISTLMRGMIFSSTFWISLGGVVLSSIVLIIMEKMKSSLMFTSVIMSVAHSVGQVIVVCFFYMQAGVAAILPYLLLGSIPMGILTGITAQLVLARIKPLKKERE